MLTPCNGCNSTHRLHDLARPLQIAWGPEGLGGDNQGIGNVLICISRSVGVEEALLYGAEEPGIQTIWSLQMGFCPRQDAVKDRPVTHPGGPQQSIRLPFRGNPLLLAVQDKTCIVDIAFFIVLPETLQQLPVCQRLFVTRYTR